MPVLPNPREERFCQFRAEGKTASESYVLAGYKANDGNACRLNGIERIQDRIAELLQGFSMTRLQWLESLGRIAAKAEKAGDFSAARGCLREIGLAMPEWYAAEKVQVDAADPLLAVLARARQRK